jgi:hypothetical protein
MWAITALSFNDGTRFLALLSDSIPRFLSCGTVFGECPVKAILAGRPVCSVWAAFRPAIDFKKAISMTKPFSAVLAALVVVGLGQTATAQFHAMTPSGPAWSGDTVSVSQHLPLDRPGWPGQVNPFVIAAPVELHVAEPPAWVFDGGYAHTDYVDLMRWSSTRPATWGVEAAPYQVAIPGPSYVGLIPQPIPEGWTVTNRCLSWDDTYVTAEQPLGECYVFEMRPMLVSLLPLR